MIPFDSSTIDLVINTIGTVENELAIIKYKTFKSELADFSVIT